MINSTIASVPTTGHIRQAGDRLALVGRAVAFAGVVLPLFMIGILKFTAIEVEALKGFIENTPWLAWLYPVFGFAGASYALGVVEIVTALLLLASLRSAWAGIVGGALAAVTFALTCSILFAFPIWEAGSGGFPFLNGAGAFLMKDVALLGVSLAVMGDSLQRLASGTHRNEGGGA